MSSNIKSFLRVIGITCASQCVFKRGNNIGVKWIVLNIKPLISPSVLSSPKCSELSHQTIFLTKILQVIFQQLEVEDLLNCKAMFRLWRDVVQARTPWKRLFHRNNESLPLWRNDQKKLEWNQRTLPKGQYRSVCKDIRQVQRNWRTGYFKKFIYEVNRGDFFTLTIGDDCVAWDYWPRVPPRTYE